VSVIVPAYNTAQFIAATLDSVFAQTLKDFEVIVVNDGSPDTDDLERVLEPYRERIVYLKQENRGLAGARNTGIRHARGKYLALLDSDDCWPPEYLAAQMKCFEETPALDLVYSDARLFGDVPLDRPTFMQTSNPPATFEALLVEGSQIIPSGTVVRREMVIEAGWFDESLRCCEDVDLCLRIAHRRARIAFQRGVMVLRRVHSDSLTKDGAKLLEDKERVLTKLVRTLELSPEARSILLSRLAYVKAHADLEKGKRYLRSGDVGQARKFLSEAYAFFRRTDRQPTGGGREEPGATLEHPFLRRAKLRVLLWGVQAAPRLTAWVAKRWQSGLSQPATPGTSEGRGSKPLN